MATLPDPTIIVCSSQGCHTCFYVTIFVSNSEETFIWCNIHRYYFLSANLLFSIRFFWIFPKFQKTLAIKKAEIPEMSGICPQWSSLRPESFEFWTLSFRHYATKHGPNLLIFLNLCHDASWIIFYIYFKSD